MTTAPRAAYLHVPFCRHRCGYCDFPLVAGRDDLIVDYLAALEIELSGLGEPQPVETLFLGGGTPTHLPVDDLRRLFELVSRWLPLAAGGEFSLEANPADVDRECIAVLKEAGVNRVSLGAQSFDAVALTVLERDHQPDDVVRVVEHLRGGGIDNISVDLIFGVPGQSLDDWSRTLEQSVALDVPHVSAYGLTYEKGTSFWRRRESGTLRAVDDETERRMYAAVMDRLPSAGIRQYEISNHARPGLECRHNQVYWRGESYYGFGPGAARYVDGVRSTNHRSVTTWLKRVFQGESGVAESEALDAEGRARELIMLGLRMTEGIDVRRFRQQSGHDLFLLGGGTLDRLLDDGLLEVADGHVRLTREGRFLADTVVSALL